MSFSAPKFGLGLVLSALVATQLLTGASAVPTQPGLMGPPSSATPGQIMSPAASQRIPELLAEVTRVANTASLAVKANELSSPSIDEAAAALTQKLREAERLTPSDWLTATSDGAHLVSGDADLIAQIERNLTELRASFTAWEGAVEAHRAEEAAQQAEKAEALAEAAAADTAPRANAGSPAPLQASPTPSGYTVSPAGTGGQSLIDACVGPVWWTPSWFPYLAEHWHCGGAAFPKQAGAIVTVAGSGVYQSAGIVKQVNAYVEDMNAVPSGYDVYYQTCLNNDPSTSVIIGLVRIG